MNTQHIDYLMKFAALSLSFVGFSTIVVALRQALGSKLSPFHLFLVRFFIETGLAVTALSFLPPMLYTLGLRTQFMWRLSSAIAALFSIIYFVSYIRRRRRVAAGSIPFRVYVNSTITGATTVGLILNTGGWLFAPSAPAYILAVTWGLVQSGLIFLQTLHLFLEASSAGKP